MPWRRATFVGSSTSSAEMPRKARRTRPWARNSPVTKRAVFAGIAKQSPCPPGWMAVLIPTTRPSPSISGPPELPGFRSASVWITPSMARPERLESERPNALTMPSVTVRARPKGEPSAMTNEPTRSSFESPSSTWSRSPSALSRRSARSVVGSSPTTSARTVRPSGSSASTAAAPWTTWLFVRARRSGETRTPDPLPRRERPLRMVRMERIAGLTPLDDAGHFFGERIEGAHGRYPVGARAARFKAGRPEGPAD